MPDTSMIKKVAPSNSGRADTPPNAPTLPPSEQTVTFKHVQQFMEIIKIAQATQALSDPVANSQAAETQGTGNHPSKEAKTRASKLEFKTVDEVYILSRFASMNSANLLHAVGMLRPPNTRSLNP